MSSAARTILVSGFEPFGGEAVNSSWEAARKLDGWRRGEPWGEGTANFAVILEWNKAKVYAKTIAAYAERLAAASQ